jgi:circadian clock protein KaiB
MINLRKILDINNRKRETNEFIFELYFAGDTPISLKAARNAKAIFDKYYKNNYALHLFDIYKNPAFVEKENIIAVPLLVRKNPLPEIRMIGDFSDMQKVKNEFLIR